MSTLRRPLPGILLVAAAAISFGACSASGASPAASGGRVAISVSEKGCDPATLTVPAGSVTFVVTNAGNDTGEFEILAADGAKVIDEVENIVPGFVVNMATRVDGGTYQMVCGGLSTPRGALTVTGGAAASLPPNTVVAEADLNAARDQYKTYVDTQVNDLVTAIGAFTAAVESGDLEKAKPLYAAARVPWERIEPIAELFPDLDQTIDFREEDFDGGVNDPGFKGFHRIEKGLWGDGSATGLAPLAVGLRADVAELKKRIDALVIDPRVMARGAGELIEEVAQSKMTGEEDRYSKADLVSIDANVDGSGEIIERLRPVLTKLDATYLASLDAAYKAVHESIDAYAIDGGFKPFDQVTAADLKLLQARLADLSELLAQLTGKLGLAV